MGAYNLCIYEEISAYIIQDTAVCGCIPGYFCIDVLWLAE